LPLFSTPCSSMGDTIPPATHASQTLHMIQHQYVQHDFLVDALSNYYNTSIAPLNERRNTRSCYMQLGTRMTKSRSSRAAVMGQDRRSRGYTRATHIYNDNNNNNNNNNNNLTVPPPHHRRHHHDGGNTTVTTLKEQCHNTVTAL
jgi:hypothetical protein